MKKRLPCRTQWWVAGLVLSVLFLSGTMAVCANPGETTETVPRVRAAYLRGEIKLDGVLNEADWLGIDSGDRVVLGNRTGDPTVMLQTECCLLYDERYLYIGARCSKAGPPAAEAATREGEVLTQDYLAFYFDRDGDGQSYLMFAVGTSGLGADVHATSAPGKGLRKDLSYTSGWRVASSSGDKEWLVEARIPLKALGVMVPQCPAEIGFDVSRRGGDRRNVVRWANPDSGVVRSGRFGRLAIGNPLPSVRFEGVELASGEDGSAVFDVHNPGWNKRTVVAQVRLKSASRSSLTSETVLLGPRESKTVRVPVVLVDPRASLQTNVAQSTPPATLSRQEVEFSVSGTRIWCPIAVCRAGQIALPVRYAARPPLPGTIAAAISVYASDGGNKVLASDVKISGASGQILLDASTLKPGRYEIRLDVSAQARPASCSVVVVPQTVRLGAEWAWESERSVAAGAGAGTAP